MNLSQALEGKKVKILDVDGEIFTGVVSDYIYPEDNAPEGIAGIILDNCPQRPYLLGLNESDIKSIEIIE